MTKVKLLVGINEPYFMEVNTKHMCVSRFKQSTFGSSVPHQGVAGEKTMLDRLVLHFLSSWSGGISVSPSLYSMQNPNLRACALKKTSTLSLFLIH